jgi:DNA-binding response OmpR family regulator
VVEDDPALVHILSATLRFGGYESEAVSKGLDALSKLGGEPYAAVLLDLGLPDIGGTKLVKMVRALTSAPILIVSGDHDQDHKIAALDAGADDFVEKPFLPGELLARIRAVLRRAGGDLEPVQVRA